MSATLGTAHNPLRLFSASFDRAVLQPILEHQAALRLEHEQKDRAAIQQIEAVRQRSWIQRDIQLGLLAKI